MRVALKKQLQEAAVVATLPLAAAGLALEDGLETLVPGELED